MGKQCIVRFQAADASYCIALNFDRGNFNVFDAFQLDRQYLTRQIV